MIISLLILNLYRISLINNSIPCPLCLQFEFLYCFNFTFSQQFDFSDKTPKIQRVIAFLDILQRAAIVCLVLTLANFISYVGSKCAIATMLLQYQWIKFISSLKVKDIFFYNFIDRYKRILRAQIAVFIQSRYYEKEGVVVRIF